HPLTGRAEVATQALSRIVRWVLLLAPLGIFAIVASAVALFGVRLVGVMGLFIATVIAGLAVLVTVVYLPAVAFGAQIDAWRYLRAIRASLLMAFSTTSSLATLPVMLDAAQRDLGISRPVASFVLPLGASIGRGGSALFQVVAVLCVARLYGVSLGLGSTFEAGAAVFLASLTAASVPSAPSAARGRAAPDDRRARLADRPGAERSREHRSVRPVDPGHGLPAARGDRGGRPLDR